MTLKEKINFIVENDGSEISEGFDGLKRFFGILPEEDEQKILDLFSDYIEDVYDAVLEESLADQEYYKQYYFVHYHGDLDKDPLNSGTEMYADLDLANEFMRRMSNSGYIVNRYIGRQS